MKGSSAPDAIAAPRRPRDTAARRAIAAGVVTFGRSFTARELYEHLAPVTPVGLVTVYRTLALLRQSGLVRDAGRRGNEALYAACELSQHHHHLVCARCGVVEESTVCRCDELEAELGRRHGFTLLPSVVNHYGLCAGCTVAER
jgi:Fur family transcriptional regulator, ferric uptake regulator